MKLALVFSATVTIAGWSATASAQDTVESLKEEIIDLAESFKGEGDPDFSKQNQLDVLVDRLLELAPQPPVEERLPLLMGAWYQVWGPYDYRNNDRGVDPNGPTDDIYQVIFPGGYYWNVSPNYKKGNRDRERVGLLRGEYTLNPENDNLLFAKFTAYPGNRTRPENMEIWELAALAEAKQLPDPITILPRWLVRILFSGGVLREVYTDNDLRITYGSDGESFQRENIYVMTKAGALPED